MAETRESSETISVEFQVLAIYCIDCAKFLPLDAKSHPHKNLRFKCKIISPLSIARNTEYWLHFKLEDLYAEEESKAEDT